MSTLLYKVIQSEPVTDKDIENELYEICCDEHSSCGHECPVYEIGWNIPFVEDLTICKCFKDGSKMLAYIRGKIKS